MVQSGRVHESPLKKYEVKNEIASKTRTSSSKQKHTFWSLFILRGLPTRESVSIAVGDEQGDLFYLAAGAHRKPR